MWIDDEVPEQKSLGSMALHLSTHSGHAISPVSMTSTKPRSERPKLRISKIWEPSIRDPADEMFLSGSFHPEFFLEHYGEDSPCLEKTFAELEDTSAEVIPKRKGGNLRRSQTVSGMSQWRQHGSKLGRAASSSSLKSLKETFSSTLDVEPDTQTLELQDRLRTLEAESQRLKDHNTQFSNEVLEWKEKVRPRLSLDTGSKNSSKHFEEVAGPRDRRSESDGSLLSPKVAGDDTASTAQNETKPPHTPTSMKDSLELPKPLQSHPFDSILVLPQQQHPRPELTPPPSPESAKTPITFEISTAKVQQIQSVQTNSGNTGNSGISGPIEGTVKRHPVNFEGIATPGQPIRTIPLSEARQKARIVPTFLGVTENRRPGTADPSRLATFTTGETLCSGPNYQSLEQPKKKRAKGSGVLHRLFRRS